MVITKYYEEKIIDLLLDFKFDKINEYGFIRHLEELITDCKCSPEETTGWIQTNSCNICGLEQKEKPSL